MRTVTGSADHVVVVGAGLSGLAAALHLAGHGRQVTVLEREQVPGGRAGRQDRGGYHLDTGPTVLTMPEIVEDTLAAVGETADDRVPMERVEPAYRAEFADGSGIDVHSDGDAMAEAVAHFAGPAEADGYRRLRAWLHRLYAAEFDRFIASNMDSPADVLTPDLARLAALGGFRGLDRMIGRFLRDERLRRVFSFQALYAGQSPQRARALYAVIAYMDTVSGVYFPRGGMRTLPDGLATAAAGAGVQFRYGETVTELERTGQRVRAARTAEGERITCDAAVLTTELPAAYELLGRKPRRPLRLRASPSAAVLHAGSRRQWAHTHHHTLLFGHAWARTFRELTVDGSLMSDPSLLVTRPTATDPGMAPLGRDLFSILAPVPNLHHGRVDWHRWGEKYAEHVAQEVERRLLPGFTRDVEFSHIITPADWAQLDMVAGTPFSLAHTLGQTGPFRPHNMPRGVDNAVLAGGGTIPGVGVPTALLSGRLAADRVNGNGTRAARRRAAPGAGGAA
ncbi:phytoene desaturase family protein [Bounagaea algeriensis]